MTERTIVASMQKVLVAYDEALERFKAAERAARSADVAKGNARIDLDKAEAALFEECERNGTAGIILKTKATRDAQVAARKIRAAGDPFPDVDRAA